MPQPVSDLLVVVTDNLTLHIFMCLLVSLFIVGYCVMEKIGADDRDGPINGNIYYTYTFSANKLQWNESLPKKRGPLTLDV